jgi:hypothetical protein
MRPGKGAHPVFEKAGRRVVVSNHQSDIPTGTLRAIRAQAGWEFPPQRWTEFGNGLKNLPGDRRPRTRRDPLEHHLS